MKGRIALLLAFFTLFLSTESSFMLHFCHNQFVAASLNKKLATCCDKKDHQEPTVSGICCELSSFDTQLNDTVLNEYSVSIELPISDFFFSAVPILYLIECEHVQQYIPRPPPKPFVQDFHTLYEQYLI